jgi:hypothetical protein
MARKAKAAAEIVKSAFDPAELNRALDEASRQQTNASEYNGHVGKITQGACERLGVSREAFTGTRRLDRKEPAKRDALIRDMLRCWRARGFFAQIDAFDDIADELASILQEIKAPGETRPSDGADALNAVLN